MSEIKFDARNRTQIIALCIIAIFWVAFTQSAIFDKSLSWGHFLYFGRIALAIIATAAITYLFFNPRRNVLSQYVLLASLFQSICSVLEPSNQIEFYQYVPYLLLINVLSYEGTLRKWMTGYFPVLLFALLLPLPSKDRQFFEHLSTFLYTFTTPIVVCFVSAVILRLGTTRFDALQENLLLNNRALDAERRAKQAAELDLFQAKKKIEEDAVKVAIAGMTQMLAHDVRRPFTMLKSAVGILKLAKADPKKVEVVIGQIEQTIPKAVSKVEGLIADVMEIGSNATPQFEDTLLSELFVEALSEVFIEGVPDNITIRRREQPDTALFVDRRKMSRALSNIIQNAREAIARTGGEIETSYRHPRPGTIRLTIRNSNSFIPEEAIPRLFDAFYTAKKGGTGLGLAIAKKVAIAHSGAISCESSKEDGVSFHIDLPTSYQ